MNGSQDTKDLNKMRSRQISATDVARRENSWDGLAVMGTLVGIHFELSVEMGLIE
jgi:hypothetical protein